MNTEAEGDPKAERITATVGLVSTRLRDLGRVLRGSMLVALFWTPQNAVTGDLKPRERDVVLAWPTPNTRARTRSIRR
jgi:hypothetical protein